MRESDPFSPRAFGPVTDNVYILNRPVQQMATKKMNGDKLLVGHTANEGSLFVPPGIVTEADLLGWLQSAQLKNLSPAQISTVLAANPNSANTDLSAPKWDTLGNSGPTAVEMSQDANGQQQRAFNIYAEATFACPAFWLASSYSKPGKAAYVYQYSVPFASHTSDLGAYFGPQEPNHSDDFALAFRRIWGNFIRTGNPSIAAPIANGAAAPNPSAPHPASNWPAWSDAQPKFVNLNITGGTPYQAPTLYGTFVTQYAQPGLQNAISVVSASNWEGGRLSRCNVYKSLAPSIPI
jgi:carboxylesterase type B